MPASPRSADPRSGGSSRESTFDARLHASVGVGNARSAGWRRWCVARKLDPHEPRFFATRGVRVRMAPEFRSHADGVRPSRTRLGEPLPRSELDRARREVSEFRRPTGAADKDLDQRRREPELSRRVVRHHEVVAIDEELCSFKHVRASGDRRPLKKGWGALRASGARDSLRGQRTCRHRQGRCRWGRRGKGGPAT